MRTWRIFGFDYSPQEVMEAHQFLYYCKFCPAWSDYDYDHWCKLHGLDGSGGSDSESSYTNKVKALAEAMQKSPASFPVDKFK
jgi:hypothetical protein